MYFKTEVKKMVGEVKEKLKLLVKRDLLYIVAIIICLGTSLYALSHITAAVDDVNAHWVRQWREYCTQDIMNHGPNGTGYYYPQSMFPEWYGKNSTG